MVKINMLFVSLLLLFSIGCQQRAIAQKQHSNVSENDEIYDDVECITGILPISQMPIFKKNDLKNNIEALAIFIRCNTIYPKNVIKDSIECRVFVSLDIDTLGNTINHKVVRNVRDDLLRDVHEEFENEALRVCRLIKFEEPAKGLNNKPVVFPLTIPVNFFKLSKEQNEYFFMIEHQYLKGVKCIKEKYNDGWNRVLNYGENGFLSNEENHFKGEKRGVYVYDNVITKDSIIINYTDYNNKIIKTKYYLDSFGRIIEIRHCINQHELTHTISYRDNGIVDYYSNNELYKKYIFSLQNKLLQKNSYLEALKDSICTRYTYNINSLIEDEIHPIDSYLTDCVPYSEMEHNRICIEYCKYDKHGNWTKSCYLTKSGKKKRSKRKIEYY